MQFVASPMASTGSTLPRSNKEISALMAADHLWLQWRLTYRKQYFYFHVEKKESPFLFPYSNCKHFVAFLQILGPFMNCIRNVFPLPYETLNCPSRDCSNFLHPAWKHAGNTFF